MAAGESEFGGTERFEIIRRLGAGGMGVVYEARDRQHDRRVALKTVLRLPGQELERLRAEFRALQGLRHQNLVALEELHEEGGCCFYTMELVEGTSFVRWVRPPAPGRDEGVLDELRLRAALGQLCRGLLALHEAGRVHRDIKPSNILVTAAGRVVLLDFGLATVLTGGADQSLPGQPGGTVEYMAPEQAAAAYVGTEADWYGVGVVLYEALTGSLPFSGAPLEVMANKQQVDPPPPHVLWPAVPQDLDALCVDLLRFDPSARPRGRRVLARLGVALPGDGEDPSSTSSHAQVFVGRERELGVLRRSFADVRRGAAVTVLVHGEAGVGKTTLGRRLAADLLAAAEP
ncbi:MAG: serine/threonine-protein kinase PknK, partial [Deltaproteobacteria bacterium]|nr:serine/threonine-protein kinase PknK [Deltaproteobacteria bacterium]